MTELFVETIGDGNPLVLVHGWGMHSGLLREFAKHLSEHYQVTLVDLPGHGRSDALKQYSMSSVVDKLVNAIPGPAVWLGWSLGGSVVLNLGHEYPDQLKGMLLVCSNPKYSVSSDWPMAMDNRVLDQFAQALQDNDQITLARFTGLMTQGEGSQTRELLRSVRQCLSRSPKADREALLWGLNVLQNGDFRSLFKHTRHPLGVLLGKNDPLIPYQVSEALKSLNIGADIQVMEDAGHVPFLSQQQEMAKQVNNFMQRVQT